MAKKKKDSELYNGLSLFDFVSNEIENKLDDLKERVEDYGTNTSGSELGLFGNEFDTRTVSGDRERTGEQWNNNDSLQLRDTGEMDKGISINQNTNGINRSFNSNEITGTNGTGDTREQYSQQNEGRGHNGYGDARREGNRPVQVLQRNNDLKIDFSSNNEIIITGAKDKYNKNIEAIKLLNILQNENRYATPEEQVTLSNYSGWGGIPQAFDKNSSSWTKEYEELKNILTEKEYITAKSSTMDSHYTPKIVIDTIYNALDRFGLNKYKETKEFLEPSAGNGAFLSFSKNHFNNVNFDCVELDKVSSNLLRKLYPNQKVYNLGFEVLEQKKKYDAVIGNPPYGQKKIFDMNNNDISMLSVHNYFMARAIKELKDDGIVAFVTSSYFLDSKDSSLREQLSNEASFVGAIRLPNNTFKNKAGTEVTTDIVFFKKGIDKDIHKDFTDITVSTHHTKDVNKPIYVNKYFEENPLQILGKMDFVMSGIGETTQCLDMGLNMEEELKKAISRLPENIYKYHKVKEQEQYFELKNPDSHLLDLKKNNYFLKDDEIYIKINNLDTDEGKVLSYKKPILNQNEKNKILKFINIRDTLNYIIELEQAPIEDTNPKLVEQRALLNKYYDEFVKKEGYLHKSTNKKAFANDVEAQKILALELEYSAGVSKGVAKKNNIEPVEASAKKADIFERRTISPFVKIEVNNPKEALISSLNQFGKIDLNYMENELNISKDVIIKDLLEKKLIFIDHTTIKNDDVSYVLAEKYLSGNVKSKFQEVQELVKEHRELESNLNSLNEVLPKDLKATEISVSLGTSWIPKEYYHQFFESHYRTNRDNWNLLHNKTSGEWTFDGNGNYLPRDIVSKYGTSRVGVFKIAENGLKNSPIKVFDTYLDEDGKQKQKINQEETALANSKLQILKNDFSEWIYKDIDRRTNLEKIYNETFNTDVEPNYNGSHLTFPNLNNSIKLRVHQKNAIWRAVQDKNVLFDHQVGAGKTLVTICSIMEQKRMGLVNKPLITVPNHLIGQWEKEFYKAYPNANLLVANKEDLEKNNREKFFGKIATNNYDAIIMTHSQFKLLPAPYEIVKEQINEDITILESMLDTQKEIAAKDGKSTRGFSIKATEEKISSFKARLDNLLQENKKSKSIDFGDLGVDLLAVDESHTYKNLLITTSMGDISGLGNLKGSQQAYDMYCKTRYLNEKNNKIAFLTGTPISNSITELYTLQRYMQPKELSKKGISSFDSWASTFGQVTSSWELDSSGVNYKIVSRFNKFNNVPELTKMYKTFADVITNNDIKKFAKDFVPKLYNDKPINTIVPRSDIVADFIGVPDSNNNYPKGSIIYRMEHQEEDIHRNNLLACTTDARKAGLDYRLINPNAKDYENSKVNAVVNNVYKEYLDWSDVKGTQLIFCDLSTPKINSQKIELNEAPNNNNKIEEVNLNDLIDNEKSKSNDELIAETSKFDIYSDILKKLVAKGVSQEEIRFIHDANTDLQKSALFDDVKSGKVRVLIGSTFKMGAGTNVQDRAVAIHHIDCPWRPSDLEQRNGRVIRQGNKLFEADPENFRIKEFRYATEKTYDARMWQTIESKAKSIEQFRQAGLNLRELEDFTMGSADAAEMKAEATGNPLILMQVQLSSDLRNEEIFYNNFKKEIFNNEEFLNRSIKNKSDSEAELKDLYSLKEHLSKNPIDNFKGSYYSIENGIRTKIDFDIPKEDIDESNKTVQTQLKNAFDKNVDEMLRYKSDIKFFDYRDIAIYGNRVDKTKVEFYLKNEKDGLVYEPMNLTIRAESDLLNGLKDSVTLTGLIKRVNNFYDSVDDRIEREQTNITKYEKDIKELSTITGENAPTYKNFDYLIALRSDNETVINEIKKMSKEKGYVSTWKPKSEAIKNNTSKGLKKERDLFEMEL
jgi:N12 class adenine-specific DNA methylase/predicted RNA methylase